METKRWERTKKLFQEAIELEPEDRSAFLDKACGTDQRLRQKVEAMLAVASDDYSFPNPALSDPVSEDPFVGTRIGRYLLNSVISSGGMGTVYEATQEQPERKVAIKIINEGILSRSTLRRFEYESQILAALKHPHIAQVIEAGTHSREKGTPVPYFVMEYISNARAITEYAREEGLNTNERLRLFLQVCDAIHSGHLKGIIHRDLKPANILVDTTIGTDVGSLIGTLQYMSPEQCKANPHDIDTRSDVYTLGIVLYELLCHRIPYDLKNAELYETIRTIREEEPIRPVTVQGDLQTILLKALSKDRARRYQSASDLASDLKHFLAREPIEAKRDSTLYVIKKKLMRRPVVTILAALAIMVSFTAVLFAYWGHLDRRAKRSAEGERAVDQALVEILCSRFDQAETCLKTAEANDIDPGRICMLRGIAAREIEDFETAIRELNIAVQRLPDSFGAKAILFDAYYFAGQFDKAAKLREQIWQLEPSTLEDYLYGGWIFGPSMPELAIKWLEIVARERPTPSVQFFLGTQRMFMLVKTYDPEQIDLALATLLSAKTQMRDNGKVAWVLSVTHLIAADINRIRGNQVNSSFHYEKAKEEARRMMKEDEEVAYPHMLSMSIAIYEDRLEDALLHLQSAAPRPGFFPLALFFTPLLFHCLGRYEEALTGLKDMPAPFKTEWAWCMSHTFLLAEVHGIDEADTCFREWKKQFGNIPRYGGGDLDYVIHSFFGQPREAVQSSREYLQKAGLPRHLLDSFDIALGRYVCNEITAEDFYTMATKRSERMHADFLIGLTHLSEGDRDAAKRRFAAVKAAGTIAFSSWFSSERWAYAFLRRLQDDPTWPPWIPVKNDGK